MLFILISLLFITIGIAAGILSVMFGFGGGFFVVPILYWGLQMLSVPNNLLMHMAAGTSLMVMIFTASNSSYFHYKKGGILFDPFFKILPSLLIGTLIAIFISNMINGQYLRLGFTVYLFYIIVSGLYKHLCSDKENLKPFIMPSALITNLFGLLVGLIATLLGVGGSTITVPFFIKHHLPLIKAVGTASLLTLPISCVGALGYLLINIGTHDLPPYSTGYIDWPAAMGIILGSFIGVPIGGKFLYKIPQKWHTPCYFAILISVFITMLF